MSQKKLIFVYITINFIVYDILSIMSYMFIIIPFLLYVVFTFFLPYSLPINNDFNKSIIVYTFVSGLCMPLIQLIIKIIMEVLMTCLISSITIRNDNDQFHIFKIIKFYMDTKYNNSSDIYSGSILCTDNTEDCYSSIVKNKSMIYSLGWGWHIIMFNNIPIFVHMDYIKYENRFNITKIINMYCIYPYFKFFDRHDIWKQLISSAKKILKNSKNDFLTKTDLVMDGYELHSYINKKELKNTTNFIFTNEMNILNDTVTQFINSNNTVLKVCIYGPPGTGKSNMAYKLASDNNLPLYNIHNTSNPTDIILKFNTITKGIIIIDEIDKFINDKKTELDNDNNLPIIHGLLDNLQNKKKLIIYFTTNNINVLRNINNGSIIRPERIHLLLKFGYVDNLFVNTMLNTIFATNQQFIDPFNVKSVKITPAKIINIVKNNNYNKILTVTEINNIINKSCTKINISKHDINKFILTILNDYDISIHNKYISYITNILYTNNAKNIEDCISILCEKSYKELVTKYHKFNIIDKLAIKNLISKLPFYKYHNLIMYVINQGKQHNIIYSDDFYIHLGDFIIKYGINSINDLEWCLLNKLSQSNIPICDVNKISSINIKKN